MAADKYTRHSEPSYPLLDRFLNVSAWLARSDPAPPVTTSLQQQLYETVKKSRRHAPGPNGLPYKAYQLLPEELIRMFAWAMGICLMEGALPAQCRDANLMTIPKKKQGPARYIIETWHRAPTD